MDEYYEQFELPLLSPAVEHTTKVEPVQPPQSSPISLLNDDCLLEVFHLLALQPLAELPNYNRGGPKTFLSITSQSHQNLDLLSCCQVSKQWHPLALRAFYRKLVIRVTERAQWYERMSSLVGGRAREWVNSVVLVGGGLKNSGEGPVGKLWELFPNLHEVEIFGLGWATGGLLSPDVLDYAAQLGVLRGVRRLEIAATSEYLLSDMPVGKNFIDVQNLLVHLPNLHHLILRGFNYRLPLSPILESPTYQLSEVLLEKCNMSLDSLRWLVGGSWATITALELPNCSLWKDVEDPKLPTELDADDEVKRLATRLNVELPVFTMCKRRF